jgi:hypothetical protein
MKKVGLFIFTLIILSSFVLAANCPPSAPKTYYGEITYNGNPISGTYEIRAMIGSNFGSNLIGIGKVLNGEYSIDISPCSGGSNVIFSVNG